MENGQTSLDGYRAAFARPGDSFLSYHRFNDDKSVTDVSLTRGEFRDLAGRAAAQLVAHGCAPGTRVLHCFGDNDPLDLAFRFGATLIGTIPVAINWQADTLDQIVYKFEQPRAEAIVVNKTFDRGLLAGLRQRLGNAVFIEAESILDAGTGGAPPQPVTVPASSTRMIVFTSGTTGNPKGVMLTYENYATNRAALEDMLAIKDGDELDLVVVNPLHHTNSSAISDWALRRPGTRLHLLSRYSTPYWEILVRVAAGAGGRVVAPVVARHIDFLETLDREGRLPVPLEDLKRALAGVNFLIGSAPVGPTTIERIERYAHHLPDVRFGSTETCLQVLGIPVAIDDKRKLAIFRRGWDHVRDGQPEPGYYIGRPHPGLTEVRIVAAIDPARPGYLRDTPDGVPGFLITRGRNLMAGYVNDPEKTASVFADGWYLGLEDICFALVDPVDGERDYFWMSRESALLIRGGSNYSCEQVNAELAAFVTAQYGLGEDSFGLAVVGLKIESEHEDACCVTIELKDEAARGQQAAIETTFLAAARAVVTKGAKPDHLRFAPIPVNFKGAVLLSELKQAYLGFLGRG